MQVRDGLFGGLNFGFQTIVGQDRRSCGFEIIATMRFKKGSKVEVLSKRDVPLGSWWCAEIVSGNGHTYLVSYDRYLAGMGPGPERVPRKDIRLCPPLTEGTMCWVPGNIVEVFDHHSWKLAEVLRVLGLNYIFVRLIGSAMEFKVHSSEIRMRQVWQDNEWVVIQKDSRRRSDGVLSKLPRDRRFFCLKMNPGLEEFNCAGDDNLPTDFTIGIKKRPPLAETCRGAKKTRRRIEKEGNCHHLIATKLPNMQEKVDAVTSPQNMLGEQYMHASFNYRNIGFSQTNGGGAMTVDKCNFRVISDHSDAESVCSSVGSCSANNSPNRPDVHYLVNGLSQYLDVCSNDAETSSSGKELSLPAKEDESEDVHQLELYAYKTTLLALYASGPISWGQEAMMTNMRCMLHISNDEHLVELRNLVSALKDTSHYRGTLDLGV